MLPTGWMCRVLGGVIRLLHYRVFLRYFRASSEWLLDFQELITRRRVFGGTDRYASVENMQSNGGRWDW